MSACSTPRSRRSIAGYQAASIDSILATTGLTKGALYHHFADKAALGHAVVDEVVRGLTLRRWTSPVTESGADPITALQSALRIVIAETDARPEVIELGCPLNNLTQEMSPRGRADGSVRADVDPRAAADLIVAAIEGSLGLAKSAKSVRMLRSNLEQLCDYLEGLRARGQSSSPLSA